MTYLQMIRLPANPFGMGDRVLREFGLLEEVQGRIAEGNARTREKLLKIAESLE